MSRSRNALGEVLAIREFRRLWSGVVTSQIGDWLHLTALGWYVLELGGDAAGVATVMAAGLLPQLLLTLIGGVAADRWPKRYVLLTIAVCQLAVAAVFAALVLAGALPVAGLTLFAFALGCLAALWQPVYLAYIPDLVPAERLETAMGLSLSALYTARAVGPAVAGVLIGVIGTPAVFLLNVVSFLGPILALASISVSGEPAKRRGSPLSTLRSSFRTVCEDTVLGALWIAAIALSLLALPFLAIVPVFAKDVFMGGAGVLGVLMSAIGLGQLVGASIVSLGLTGRIERSGMLQLAGYLAMGILLGAFAISPNVPLAAINLFLFNLLHGLLSPRVNAIVQRRMTSGRGTGQALFLLVYGLVPVGQVALGWLAVRVGVERATFAFGVAFVIAVVALLLAARGLRAYTTAVSGNTDASA